MRIKDDLIDALHGILVRLNDLNIRYTIDAWNHSIKFYLDPNHYEFEISDDDIYEVYGSIEHAYNFLKNYGFDVEIKIITMGKGYVNTLLSGRRKADINVNKTINLDQLKNDLISKEYKTYANNPITIAFKQTDRCYNHIFPRGSKMLDEIGGYDSTWNKKFKDVGEVGNFNESIKSDQTPTQIKFLELKDIIEDLHGLLVELADEEIYYLIEPNDEIKLRTMTLLNNFKNIDFIITIGRRLYRNEEHIHLIYDRIESIVSYMKIKGYDTTIKMKTLLKMRTDNLKFDKNFERFYYKYFENTDYIELEFTSLEVNESLPRQHTVDQLKRVMKLSAKTDIGNRISDMNKQGANIDYIRNPIDSGIESYEDFEKHNKRFVPSWNLKHLLSPFSSEIKKKNKK